MFTNILPERLFYVNGNLTQSEYIKSIKERQKK